MDNLLDVVNNSVLQDKINSIRNQKEEIRRRLENPGLYKSDQQVIPSQEVLSSSYRPASSLQNAALSDLSSIYGGGSNTTESQDSGYYSGMPSGLGLNGLMAGIGGTLVGIGASRMGAGPISGIASAIASGLLGQGIDAGKLGRTAMQTAISTAIPGLAPVLGLMSLFGMDPMSKAAKAFGIEGLMNQKDLADYTYSTLSGGQYGSLSEAMDALGKGYGLGDAPMSGTPSEVSSTEYGGLGSMYGDAPMAGSWSDTISNDYGSSGLGSDYGSGYSSGDNSYGGSSGNE